MQTLSYFDRIPYCKNVVAMNLLHLMYEKKTNLALAADVVTADKLLFFADQCGPEICILKTHIDIIEDFTPALIVELKKLAERHRFLLFEDRKFADIGTTVKQQYQGGIYRIADWADMVNAHPLPGPGIITGLAEVGLRKQRGLILLAEMSSANNLIQPGYIEQTMRLAEQHAEFVFGFISQKQLNANPQWIYLTPGIQLDVKSAAHGQQYITPTDAVIKNGSDVLIVGRGIMFASSPKEEAQRYREIGWQAYLDRIEKS